MRSFCGLTLVLFLLTCGINYVILHPRGRGGLVAWVAALGTLLPAMGALAMQAHTLPTLVPSLRAGLGAAVAPLRSAVWDNGLVVSSWHSAVLAATVLPTLAFGALTLDKPWARAMGAYAGLGALLTAGASMAQAETLGVFFLSFELLLLTSIFLLLVTSKADRIAQALGEMLLWTLVGSLALLTAIGLLASSGVTRLAELTDATALDPLVGVLLLGGFCVKLPVWPCYSWLLRAHVEASVEFSILLSGVVVKFGALGLARVLAAQPTGPAVHVFMAACVIAMVEATLRLGAQRDLKRIVALTTVIEMNWAGFCLSYGGAAFHQTAAFLLVAHSFATTGEFFLTEVIYRRFHSRDVTQLAGLYTQAPTLWALSLVTVLTTIGFPGTSLFAAKVGFLAALTTGPWFFFPLFTLLLMVILPLLFVRLWAPMWFGTAWVGAGGCGAPCRDLTSKEATILILACLGSVVAGLMPHLFLGEL